MIARVDIAEISSENNYEYALLPFYKNSAPYEFINDTAAHWGMSLRAAGSMRFRWNETNPNRDNFLKTIAGRGGNDKGIEARRIVPLAKPVSVELIHSKIVYDLKSGDETFQKQGDGMITQNKNLIPVVTVADCVPLYLYEPESGVFGIVHSGWKGTGIIGEAIKLAAANYGAKPKNFLIAIGAHIHDCCYIVDGERAKYFTDNFGGECVQNNRLSLLKANLAVLEKAGVLEENIVAATNCTCCDERFGSFRRQAAFSDAPDKTKAFTVQAAFVRA